jgi:hypothetical protein
MTTYKRVIIIDYDPSEVFLPQIKHLTHAKVLEAELVVVRRKRVHCPSGLIIQMFITEKDRYQQEGRKLSKKELISIVNASENVITLSKKGVVSEKQA